MKTKKGIETCTHTHARAHPKKRFRNIQKYHTPAKHVTKSEQTLGVCVCVNEEKCVSAQEG